MGIEKYVEPSSDDIGYLKQTQECEKELSILYKDQKHADIGFFSGLVLFVLGMIGRTDLFLAMGGIGLCGLLLGGGFKYSYSKGEGKFKKIDLAERRGNYLNKVKCQWHIKGDKYYVYLEDGKKIEVDEY